VTVFKNYDKLHPVIKENCNKWVDKFSDEEFKDNFIRICKDQKFLI
jgi:hypothetical protein